MDRACGIDGCGCSASVMLPWSPIEHYALCAKHARGWHGSKIRKILTEERASLSDYEARRAFKLWAITEALGRDPQTALRTEAPAIARALAHVH